MPTSSILRFPVPELASFPCAYSTAENMLTRAKVAPGDTILRHWCFQGGVGSAAIQLAFAREATVVAVTGPQSQSPLKEIGADKTLLRDQDYVEFLGRTASMSWSTLSARPRWSRLLDVMRPGGRYAVSRPPEPRPTVELDLRTLYLKDLSFFGCTILDPNVVFGNLVSHIEAGHIRPLVAETYGLDPDC